MKALIIYEDLADAARARAALEHAALSAGVRTEWEVRPWRLDVLSLPAAAEEALLEAADADLVVFACRGTHPLPGWLEDWLECWVLRRRVGDAALAVLEGKGFGMLSVPASNPLARFSARHGLRLIAADASSSPEPEQQIGPGFQNPQIGFGSRFENPASMLPSTFSAG